jgi:hypothetical protein
VERDFDALVLHATKNLRSYRDTAKTRITQMRETNLTDDRANSLILQAYEEGTVGSRLLRPLIEQWREPTYEEFKPRTAWSLINCFTHVMKDRQKEQPVQAAVETMRFQNLLLPAPAGTEVCLGEAI